MSALQTRLQMALTHWLESVWYGSRPIARGLLYPLGLLFCCLAGRRRERLRGEQARFPVPVVVVGNIAVGGTGKTPLVIWLVGQLRAAGFKPGVVSRGVGSRQPASLPASAGRWVLPTDPAAEVGDEPLLMVQRTGVPLVVGKDRPAAIRTLLQHCPDCNLILSDDGLQHYRMARDVEIVVLDGERRFGNGLCLPAGPLREPPERVQSCDFVVVNNPSLDTPLQAGREFGMSMQGDTLLPLAAASPRPLSALAGQAVHVVTAIGNPGRFLARLQAAGIQYKLHAYPDHYHFTAQDIHFGDGLPVLMTEKDAVKCQGFAAALLADVWYLPVEAHLDKMLLEVLLQKLKELADG